MQNNLLNQLLKINTFSVQLTSILDKISKYFSSISSSKLASQYSKHPNIPTYSIIKQIQQHLVSLTCQNKNLLHHKYVENKINNQHCIAYIVQILLSIVQIYKESISNVAQIFMSHILSHPSCFISYYTLMMLIEGCPNIVEYIGLDKILELNNRIQKQLNIYDDIVMLHSIKLKNGQVFSPQHLQICENNLSRYLYKKQKPKVQKQQQHSLPNKIQGPMHIKIPPLSLPTSKSINSQRYSALSKQSQIRALAEFHQLGNRLGQNFITIQLGCLLSNKRTRQVQQFSENETFRKNCIEKIEKIHTQRMNSSRISLILGSNLGYENMKAQKNVCSSDQNSRNYYLKVLTANCNIFLKKMNNTEKDSKNFISFVYAQILKDSKKIQNLKQQKYFHSIFQYIKQIIDINIIQGSLLMKMQPYNSLQAHNNIIQRQQNINVFTHVIKNIKSIEQITKTLMDIISCETQRSHYYLLSNQNKQNLGFHYDYDLTQYKVNAKGQQNRFYQSVIQDELLGNSNIIIQSPKIAKGNFKIISEKHHTQYLIKFKQNADPILFVLGSFLQSLQQSADMSHPLFYKYQTNILKTVNFYLQSTLASNRLSTFYIAQFIMPLIIMLKRQILQLSHPYLKQYRNQSESRYKKELGKNRKKVEPLIFTQPQLMDQYIRLLTSLVESNNPNIEQEQCSKKNKYIQKLFANIFLKNLHFMEMLQNYTQFIFEQHKFGFIQNCLNFYKKLVEIYTNGSKSHKNKSGSINQNKSLKNIYEHLCNYLDPKSGCLAKILKIYQVYISPSKLQQAQYESESQNNPITKEVYQIQHILHQILSFISTIYYIATPDHPETVSILDQQIASFYIKYSIMGFIKLYSLITVTELVNINTNCVDQKPGIDFILSTKQSPHSSSQVNVKQIFMIDFLKILTHLSINRTQQIAKKFRQYRVLQFFVREIELQFSVAQNIEKYIKKAKDTQQIHHFTQPQQHGNSLLQSSSEFSEQNCPIVEIEQIQKVGKKHKKLMVPGLNLTGQIFQKGQKSIDICDSDNQIKKQSQIGQFRPPFIQKLPLRTQENPKHISNKSNKTEKDLVIKNKKKGYLDDMLEQIVKPRRKSQSKKSGKQKRKSIKGHSKNIKTQNNFVSLNMDLGLNLNLDTLKNKSTQNNLDDNINNSKSYKESDAKIIYQTQRKIRKIYSNKILHSQSILLILSLVLYQGQLDPFYCDQMPVIHGKLNVLYLLHYHLNHQSNKSILPILSQNVKKIKPYLSGQRLFKLLSNSYTDISQYYDWTKLNAGAYGVVMSASTQLNQPKQVAIKQMNFPKSIYERCVLHDIFTEITCLDMFRLEERVTKMYNYGVIDNTYIIVMKKYACSVKDWRLGNAEFAQVKLFPPTLPNILALFFQILKGVKLLHQQNVTHYDIKGDNILLDFFQCSNSRQFPVPKAIFADFGVCKSFISESDQLDLQSRGTQCIKSPQMLTLSLKNKKQSDNFDRRKKIGTTRASDIWSLGCLLYQLITGQFLFNSNDWVHFFMQVTSPSEQILHQNQCEKMNNNVYLIDFLKYILIRDPQHRPSIQNIIARFQNLYALLVSNPERFASSELRNNPSRSLDEIVKQYIQAIQINDYGKKSKELLKQKNKQFGQIRHKDKKQKTEGDFGKTGKIISFFNPRYIGKMMKIMDDIYFCESEKYLLQYQNRIRIQGITHIIIFSGAKVDKYKFKVMQIIPNSQSIDFLIFRLCPRISDFLRQVLLVKGKLLFVNNQTNYATNLMIFVLSYWFKCSIFETWCLINTQILSFPTFSSNQNLKIMSKMLLYLNEIEKQTQKYPKLQCICGSVTVVLQKKFQEKKGQLKPCICNKKRTEKTSCFSKNCLRYLQFIKKRYNIIWDNLTWAFINPSDLLTPLSKNISGYQDLKTRIILNSSPPFENMIQHETHNGYRVASCKICDMWILSSKEDETWIILNNLIKSYRQGIMIPNAQQQFKVKTPALNYFTLSKLHMTSQ